MRVEEGRGEDEGTGGEGRRWRGGGEGVGGVRGREIRLEGVWDGHNGGEKRGDKDGGM